MKLSTCLRMLTLTVVSVMFAMTAQGATCSAKEIVDINIHPGEHPNIIDPRRNSLIPVVIFGSAQLDINKVDPQSLRLRVNALWEPSRVETAKRKNSPLCKIRDIGSHNENYSDNLGPQDGYDDLICRFTNELAMFQGGVQQLSLTGTLLIDDRGEQWPIYGYDSGSGPGGLEDIVRCCITCDSAGSCSGCNSDIYNCSDHLKQCSGSDICYDCTGCKAPEVC